MGGARAPHRSVSEGGGQDLSRSRKNWSNAATWTGQMKLALVNQHVKAGELVAILESRERKEFLSEQRICEANLIIFELENRDRMTEAGDSHSDHGGQLEIGRKRPAKNESRDQPSIANIPGEVPGFRTS
jgi:hypothetical protein